jgi:hypothetical protein
MKVEMAWVWALTIVMTQAEKIAQAQRKCTYTPNPVLLQGSVLQNLISAENFSDKFSSQNSRKVCDLFGLNFYVLQNNHSTKTNV